MVESGLKCGARPCSLVFLVLVHCSQEKPVEAAAVGKAKSVNTEVQVMWMMEAALALAAH